MYNELQRGDLVWFDPGVGYALPGEVIEYHESAQVVMVQAIINNVTKNFTLNNLSSVRLRQDLGQSGVEDMITLRDINEASILWNLRLRYDNRNIYTFIGTILISVNPYRAFDDEGENLYGLKSVAKYDGQILGTLPPHLFAIGSAALTRQVAYPKKNVTIVLNGEAGSGKTECSKLLLQYLSAVNKSASNLKTEQIIEASHLLESFGHAQTLRNNNSSRFGKFIQIYFKDGVISGAKFHDYLLEKSRIVSHNSDDRNFHIFYEMLAGLSLEQKEKFGLMTPDKYFYLNQGQNSAIDGKNDKAEFENLISSFQVLGFSLEERDAILKVLASILHLGNVYFHRKHFRNGVEGVEMGSNVEIKWAAHLLQVSSNGLTQVLTSRLSPESIREPIIVPMNIDQALDVRDALSKALFGCLFSWLIKRINKVLSSKNKGMGMNKGICILDIFGFEDLNENSFEQLCINFANENLHSLINRRIFKAEQSEYAKEKIEWTPINYVDNGPILNILAKKPVGIFHLLDDESNFPKANDTSFLDKCHYNHALNELYSRPRMSSREFGIKHYAGQVWYNVDGFLKKNRDHQNPEIINLLASSKDRHLHNIFSNLFQSLPKGEMLPTHNSGNDHLITMKPRTATVSARFIDNLHQLLGIIQDSHPFYVLCIKPNGSKIPSKFDMPLVLDQLRVNSVLETIMIRKTGYPIRMKYKHFVEKFRCLLGVRYPDVGYYGGGSPTTKETARNIAEKYARNRGEDYEFGSSKVFLKESLRKKLETERRQIHDVTVVKLQRAIRGHLARKDFLNKKKSAVKIQSAYRGWATRNEYNKARKGVIALQAIYRMRRQRGLYVDLKDKIRRQEEEEKRRHIILKQQEAAILEEKRARKEKARLARKQKMSEEESEHARKISREYLKREITSPATIPLSSKDFEDEEEYFDEIDDAMMVEEEEFTFTSQERTERGARSADIIMREKKSGTPSSLSELIRSKSPPNKLIKIPPKLSLTTPSPPVMCVSPHPTSPKYSSSGALLTSREMQQKVNHLEIPAELAFIMSKTEKSEHSRSSEKNLGKISEPLPSVPFRGDLKLPNDIDYYSFSKVANIYFKHHLWEMKREPIKTPFLSKSKESDYQEALAVFKLILRFMNDPNLGGMREKMLSDYIVNKGIRNEKLRDEIYCQLANQTRKNNDPHSNERGWFLISNCLSSFPPSKTLYKYLLKYVSDNGANGYKYVCQQKLLQAGINHESRVYPPTNLEWHSNKKAVRMALDATFPDLEIRPVPIESFTTAEEFAANALTSRGISELSGWTVGYERDTDSFELNGSDFVLDVLSEGELPSIFPKGKIPFLQLSGETRSFKESGVPLMIPSVPEGLMSPVSSKKRSHSEDRLLCMDDFGLSSGSILNNRYFDSSKETASKSKSMDNLLSSEASPSYGLSESSRLNERYHQMQQHSAQESESSQRVMTSTTTKTTILSSSSNKNTNNKTTTSKTEWEKIGLSTNNPLNDRYFSQPDLLEAAKSEITNHNESSSALTRSSGNLKLSEELEMAVHQNHLTNILKKGRPRFVKGGRRNNIKLSSAMSDTSEAPSIASHVRRVRVPSQASDVDQFLDDLFMPVLDVEDGLSDAKSLAASMKGGKKTNNKEEPLSTLSDVTQLVDNIRGTAQGDLPPPPPPPPVSTNRGFQPIPGVVSPAMSPPPMLIPTPVQGTFMQQAPSGNNNNSAAMSPPTISQDGSALAFTYVPVPVYNMGGIGLPGMMSPKPPEESPNNVQSSNIPPPNNSSYQEAFIQNAVAQNMQIQQQLMMQNQALSQLLSQANPQPSSLTSVLSGLKINEASNRNVKSYELHTQRSMEEENMSEYIQTSKTTPNTPKLSSASMEMELAGIMDPYMRARTVRIGKWRWPPPKEEMGNGEEIVGANEGFFEFKMRKMQEKRGGSRSNLISPTSPNENLQQIQQEHLLQAAHQHQIREKLQAQQQIQQEHLLQAAHQHQMREKLQAQQQIQQEHLLQAAQQHQMREKLQAQQQMNEDHVQVMQQQMQQQQQMNDQSLKAHQDQIREQLQQTHQQQAQQLHQQQLREQLLQQQEFQEQQKIQQKQLLKQQQLLQAQQKEFQQQNELFQQQLKEQKEQHQMQQQAIQQQQLYMNEQHKRQQQQVYMNEQYSNESQQRTESDNKNVIDNEDWDHDVSGVRKLKLSNDMKNRLEAAVIKSHSSVDENGKLELSELEMHDDDDDEVNQMNSGIQRLSENRKFILEQKLNKLKKWNTMEEVHRKEQSSDVLDGPPPPRQFVFPGSLSTKTGGRLSRAKYETEDLFESTIKNRHNSIEYLSRPGETHEDDYQSVDDISTKLHPPNSDISYLYTRNVPWNVHIRKEIFSPSESLNNPLLIHLIFTQIVRDASRDKRNLRLTNEEASRLCTLLDEYSINLENVGSTKHRLSTKKNIIEMTKDFDYYFSRLYPISSGVEKDSQFLSISHKGVRLVRRVKGPSDYLETLETYTYEDIGEVSTIKSTGLQIVTHTGGRLLATTPKAPLIKDLLNTYLIEANASSYDYVKALGEFHSGDENAISFRKGDIIAVVPKRDSYTEKGWLYGIKDGSYGLFPAEFVEKLSPKSIRREMRIIAHVTQRSKEEAPPTSSPLEDEDIEEDMGPVGQTDEEDDEEENQVAWESKKSKKEIIRHSRKEILQEVNASSVAMSHASPEMMMSDKDGHPDAPAIRDDGKNPLLEFALLHFQDSMKMRSELEMSDKKNTKGKKGKASKKQPLSSGGLSGTVATNDWTWKDKVDLVKWTPTMISSSLLRLDAPGHNNLALECFASIMRVMGDLPLLANHHEVNCVNTIIMYCHKFESIRDEVYCQIMKQTTNNKSINKDSCQKGWRLFSIIAAYFSCSEVLKPYLFKYLESAAYDKRRAYHGTALVCLQNLRKTFKYGGRKNIPSIEEITAIVAGRSSKRQIYRLPGGTERIINTKSTTVVADVIDEFCNVIGVQSDNEKEEFSLYCIIEGELYTMPLSPRHYILDLTNGLQHQHEEFYLIFCRSVWHYPLRLDNALYVEVVFNQIAPDYLEGHLLVMPDGVLQEEDLVYDIAKIASLLHKAADMNGRPSIKETKFLLPKPILNSREIKPPQWVNMVQSSWKDVEHLNNAQAKGQVLTILSKWPLFGSSFFVVSRVSPSADAKGKKEQQTEEQPVEEEEELLALNKDGVSFLDQVTHVQLLHYPFTEVISTRKVEIEDRSLYLDMKCGNLMSQTITRIKTFQADEIARLIRQYITIDQKLKGVPGGKGASSQFQ